MTQTVEKLYDFTLEISCGFRAWPDNIEYYCQVTYPELGWSQVPITVDYTDAPGSLDTFIEHATQDIAIYMKDPEGWTKNYIAHSGETERQLQQAQAHAEEIRQDIAQYQRAAAYSQELLAKQEALVDELQAALEKEG